MVRGLQHLSTISLFYKEMRFTKAEICLGTGSWSLEAYKPLGHRYCLSQ
jgi:hypothetical protein